MLLDLHLSRAAALLATAEKSQRVSERLCCQRWMSQPVRGRPLCLAGSRDRLHLRGPRETFLAGLADVGGVFTARGGIPKDVYHFGSWVVTVIIFFRGGGRKFHVRTGISGDWGCQNVT